MTAKRNLLRYILLLCCCIPALAQAQFNQNGRNNMNGMNGMNNTMGPNGMRNERDSLSESHVDANTVPHSVRAWHLEPRFGEAIVADVDTLHLNFQNSNENYGYKGEYNMLGNLGSPRLNRIFMDRKTTSESFFLDPLDFYMRTPENQLFYDTKSPFTNLSYWTCGNKVVGDDHFKALFTVNANKRLNVGFILDYLYARGYYQYQGISYFNGALFTSYRGDRYRMNALFSNNHMKMAENGGIENDMFITNPEEMSGDISSNTIPTLLSSTWNRNDNQTLYFNQQYNVGFHRQVNDSTREFVPVTSFIHTLQLNTNKHEFRSYEDLSTYYLNDFLPSDTTSDISKYMSLKNTLAIQLKEGFNKWAQAGLTGFVRANMRTYKMRDLNEENIPYMRQYNETMISAGGMLSRTQGKLLNYKVLAETTITGEEAGDVNVEGDFGLNFRLLGDTVTLAGKAYMKNQTPAFFLRHYHGRHFWWDADLDKELRTRIEGSLSSKRTGTTIRISAENIKNYTYLNNLAQAVPGSSEKWLNAASVAQNSGNIQVMTAQLTQNFKFGIVHWDNEVTYQTTSDIDILPLPKLNVYSNLYLSFPLVKDVLRMQLGGDVRYFTKYYAPDYTPGLQQYLLQNPDNRVEIGNYPIINTYVNAEWKRTRIYLQVFSHLNQGKGTRNYFLVPHYPINPSVIKIGISWSFYD